MWIVEGKIFLPFFFSNGRSLCEIIIVALPDHHHLRRRRSRSSSSKIVQKKLDYSFLKKKRDFLLRAQLGLATSSSQDELPYAGDWLLHIADFESRHPI